MTTTADEPGTARFVGGRYELLEVIGRGGSATVHRAVDHRSGRVVAVKLVAMDVHDRTSRQRRRESDALAAIHHPGLVRVLDQVENAHATAVVMELMEGGTLRDRLRARPVDEAALAPIAADVAAGLAHLHSVGIVHRDVKPANVLLDRGPAPVAKLADFGIAKLLDSSATQTIGVVGTAFYLSPEQVEGVTVGAPSDVYSLGLTLLEALTGRPAFPGSVAESVAARLVRDPDVPAALDERWQVLLRDMTQRDAAARPRAEDVARRARLLATDDGAADTMPLPVLVTPLVRHRPPVRRGAAAASVAVALTAVMTLAAAAPAQAPERAVIAATATTAPVVGPATSYDMPRVVVEPHRASTSGTSTAHAPKPRAHRDAAELLAAVKAVAKTLTKHVGKSKAKGHAKHGR